jgi:hypothetical protein
MTTSASATSCGSSFSVPKREFRASSSAGPGASLDSGEELRSRQATYQAMLSP